MPATRPRAHVFCRRAVARLAVTAGIAAIVAFAASPFAASPAGAAPSATSSASPESGSGVTSPGSATKPAKRATFGIAPVTPGQHDTRTYYGLQIAPGYHYSDHFALFNYTNAPIALTILAADVTNDTDGTLLVGKNQASAKDAGKWIALGHATNVTVPAQTTAGAGEVVIPFTVKVPASATPGDHDAAVAVELSSAGGTSKNNVDLLQRLALRIAIRVPGDLKPSLEVRDLKATYQQNWDPIKPGSVHVHYAVVDTGNTVIGARQAAAVSGWFGVHVAAPRANTAEVPYLLPGGSETFDYTIKDVWPTFLAHFSVTETPLLSSGDATDFHLGAVRASTSIIAIPWPQIICLLVLVALVLGYRRYRSYRRGHPRSGRGGNGIGETGPGGPDDGNPEGDGPAGGAPDSEEIPLSQDPAAV